MKRFMPLIKIAVGVVVGIATQKANQNLGVVVDPDALNVAILAALTAANIRNKPDQPVPQRPASPEPSESDR